MIVQVSEGMREGGYGTNLSERGITDIRGGCDVTIDNHKLALGDGEPSWVSFLTYVTVLTPHQSHQNLLQILDI